MIDSNDMRDSDSQLEQRLEETEKQLHASEEAWISSIKKLKWSRREFLTIFDSVPAMNGTAVFEMVFGCPLLP